MFPRRRAWQSRTSRSSRSPCDNDLQRIARRYRRGNRSFPRKRESPFYSLAPVRCVQPNSGEMVAMMISARFAAAIAGAVYLISAASPAAEPDRVDLRIEVFGFAGLHVLTNRTSVAASADQYAIAMDLDTRGIASIFVDLTSHSEVRGRIGRDFDPQAYRADVHRNGIDHSYRIDYRTDGAVATAWKP